MSEKIEKVIPKSLRQLKNKSILSRSRKEIEWKFMMKLNLQYFIILNKWGNWKLSITRITTKTVQFSSQLKVIAFS
jgi:hypothetical protein